MHTHPNYATADKGLIDVSWMEGDPWVTTVIPGGTQNIYQHMKPRDVKNGILRVSEGHIIESLFYNQDVTETPNQKAVTYA